ncbi:MAG: hypothetical protein COT85_01695 [Chlamydiae bacterium CG10_big_fil_rev_8_21_14_0_10_42_34]|nr:MAG: hypothetical protein COT85_01695 [Chlamydiae bacterium CG10_big_fil_rev_8_21_14_0_10_42_34]
MASVRIVDEELKIRSLQGAAHTTPLPLPSSAKTHLSTLAPAEEISRHPKLTPVLPEPRHYLLNVLDKHLETERLTEKRADLFEREVSLSQTRIDELDAEKQEALENEARSTKSRATWSTLSIVSQYISSTATLALAASSSGIAYPLFIASGVIGLGNRVLQDTHLLPAALSWITESKALQKKIEQNINTGALCLQMGLNLSGAAALWQTGALAAAQINSNSIANSLKTTMMGASSATSAASQIGQGYYDKQIAYLRAEMRDIETNSTDEQLSIHNLTKEVGKMIDAAQTEADELRKAIQALQISID